MGRRDKEVGGKKRKGGKVEKKRGEEKERVWKMIGNISPLSAARVVKY